MMEGKIYWKGAEHEGKCFLIHKVSAVVPQSEVSLMVEDLSLALRGHPGSCWMWPELQPEQGIL